MALETKAGTFAVPASIGNQSVTGVGFQPSLVLFFVNGLASAGGSVGRLGFGAAVSSSSRAAVSLFSNNAQTTTECDRYTSNADCIVAITSGGTTFLEADFVSMDSDGFTVNWSSVLATVTVGYLAIGGSDLSNVAIKEFTSKTSTGTQAITGVGFQPDSLIVFTTGESASPPASSTNCLWSLGAASGSTERACFGISSEDGQGTSDTDHIFSTDQLINATFNGSAFLTADLDSLDSDGFTLDWSVANGTARYCYAVCLKGGQFFAGNDTQKTSTGTKATTGVGFQPTGLLGFGMCGTGTTLANEARGAIGFASGASTNTCISTHDEHGQGTTDTSRYINNDEFLQAIEAGGAIPTVLSEANLSSLDSDGFTLDWGVADASARRFGFLAFGSTAGSSVSATLSEGVSNGDSVSCTITTSQTVSEGNSLGDSFTSLLQLLSNVSEGSIFGESISRIKSVVSSLTDGHVLSDTNINVGTLVTVTTEGSVLGDTKSSTGTFFTSTLEGHVLTDQNVVRGDLLSALSDQVVLSDSVSSGFTFTSSLSEGVLTGDSTDGTVFLTSSLIEETTHSDVSNVTGTLLSSSTEGLSLSDVITEVATLLSSVSDGIDLGDTFVGSIGTLTVSLTEGLTLGDENTNTLTGIVVLSEGTEFGDTFSVATDGTIIAPYYYTTLLIGRTL